MNSGSINNSNNKLPHLAANAPLERVAASRTLSESEKVQEASRQFESMLLRQILGDAQKPVTKQKSNSVSDSIYKDMVTSQFADSISSSGGIGLATSLNKQLSHSLKPTSNEGDVKNEPVRTYDR